ncbi:hypothetical protein, partial [Chromobacterium piscinae]
VLQAVVRIGGRALKSTPARV